MSDTYPEKITRDSVVALFVPTSVVLVTLAAKGMQPGDTA